MYIKYFTKPTFDNMGFAAILREKMNIRAIAVDDGIILDKEAFLTIPNNLMPTWAYLNKAHINDPSYTRQATSEEVKALTGYAHRYIIKSYNEKAQIWSLIEASNSINDLKSHLLLYQTLSLVKHISFYIIDQTTGEIMER